MKKYIGGYEELRGGFCRATAVLASLLSIHCAGEAGDTQPSPVASDSSELLVQTIHAGEQANIFVQVAPNSACRLRATGLDDVAVYGDVRGVASFFASLDQVGASADMSLECKSAKDTSTKVYPVRLTAVPADEDTTAPTAWLDRLPYPGRTIPALTLDPDTVTPQQLADLGMPRKPDRLKAPQAYSSWLERVSKPTLAIDSALADTGNVNDISPYRDYNNTWAGYDDYGYSGITSPIFVVSWGQWVIPKVTGPSTGTYYSSIWVGMGGHDNTYGAGLPQTGTEQQASCSRFGTTLFCTGTYYAWVEYYPAGEQRLTSFTVHQGDTLFAEAYTNDNAGTTATLYLQNVTTNTTSYTTLSLPSGATFYADTAEWVVERPLHNGQATNLAKFSDITITSAGAMLVGNEGQAMFNFADPSAYTEAIDMVNGSNGHSLATAQGPTDWGTFAVHWQGSN